MWSPSCKQLSVPCTLLSLVMGVPCRGGLVNGNLSCCYYLGSILIGYGSVLLNRWQPKVPKWNCRLSGSSVYIQSAPGPLYIPLTCNVHPLYNPLTVGSGVVMLVKCSLQWHHVWTTRRAPCSDECQCWEVCYSKYYRCQHCSCSLICSALPGP